MVRKQKEPECDIYCRDGAFVVGFTGTITKWQEMRFLLATREDGFSELLGGGYDVGDLTPEMAGSRELGEEAGILIRAEELTFFANMVQRLPLLGPNERGYVFYFLRKFNQKEYKGLKFTASKEHKVIRWHTLFEILEGGEALYKTSTLRAILLFLNFLHDKKVKLGVLRDKVSFQGYEF